jgi:uncharacterized hydantoinase/oxoprolinase family protein
MELLTLIILLFVMFLLWYQTGQLSKICQQQAGLIDALAGLILVVKDAGREITQATQQLERLKQIERNTGTLRGDAEAVQTAIREIDRKLQDISLNTFGLRGDVEGVLQQIERNTRS